MSIAWLCNCYNLIILVLVSTQSYSPSDLSLYSLAPYSKIPDLPLILLL